MDDTLDELFNMFDVEIKVGNIEGAHGAAKYFHDMQVYASQTRLKDVSDISLIDFSRLMDKLKIIEKKHEVLKAYRNFKRISGDW